MSDRERTEYGTPIPLRGNETGPGEEERPNPWSRLEAVSAVRERLGWLAEHLTGDWEVVGGADVGVLVDQLADELHTALWGSLVDVERVRHRVPKQQLVATWATSLYDDGPRV